MLSYIQFVWTTSKQRSAVKRAHGGKLPDLLPAVDAQDNVPNENLPVAEVVHTATHPGTYEQQPQLRPAQNVSENRNLSRGRGSNTPEIYIANRNPAFDTSPPGPDPFLDDSNTRRNSQKQIKFGYTKGRPGPVAEAALDRKEHSHGSFDTQPKGSELPADIPESAEATAAEAEKSRGVKGFFKRLWESVCEDRAIGFKCAANFCLLNTEDRCIHADHPVYTRGSADSSSVKSTVLCVDQSPISRARRHQRLKTVFTM